MNGTPVKASVGPGSLTRSRNTGMPISFENRDSCFVIVDFFQCGEITLRVAAAFLMNF